MKPGRYRGGGAEETIVYSASPCGLGWLLVGATAAGVCAVRLGDNEAALIADVRAEFPAAALARDDAALKPWVDDLLAYLDGREPHLALPPDVRGTASRNRMQRVQRTQRSWSSTMCSPMSRALPPLKKRGSGCSGS